MNVREIERILPLPARPVWLRLVNAVVLAVPRRMDSETLVAETLGHLLMTTSPDAFAESLEATYRPELPPVAAVAKARRDEAEAAAANANAFAALDQVNASAQRHGL